MTLLDGFKVAKIRNEQLKLQIEEDTKKGLTVPKAAIILVGDDPASKIYVNSKLRDSKKVGILSELVELPADVSEDILEQKIRELNNDDSVTGILLQLPLPKHLDDKKFINLIDTKKDIDGFTLANQGLLFQG